MSAAEQQRAKDLILASPYSKKLPPGARGDVVAIAGSNAHPRKRLTVDQGLAAFEARKGSALDKEGLSRPASS